MELMHIPLTELKIAKTNVRHGVTKADYKDLIPSIKERGILQPLLVRANGQGYEIVAGRRRFLAACEVEKEGTTLEAVPCAIMAKGDDAAALEASLIENVAHLPMDEMDQFEAFQRLLKEGRSVDDIAHVFGVTELTVKRRLAIANLHPKIRQLYRAEEIDAETLRALTLATKQQQKDWLVLWDDEEQHAPRGNTLKKWLLGGENTPASRGVSSNRLHLLGQLHLMILVRMTMISAKQHPTPILCPVPPHLAHMALNRPIAMTPFRLFEVM